MERNHMEQTFQMIRPGRLDQYETIFNYFAPKNLPERTALIRNHPRAIKSIRNTMS